MAGLSFIHFGFLAAGLAAAAPVVIHLLFRQRAQKVYIGSVRFLQNVIREHHRRRRVRQWLLLALRVMAVLLLAFLFARPYVDRAARDSLQQIVVVLVDRSASMRSTDASGTTAYARAVKAARQQLAAIPDNVVVHLGAFDATGVVEGKVDELARLPEAGWAGTDYRAGLSWAHDLLTLSPRPQQRVVLITDLQRTALESDAADALPDGAQFEIIDVGEVVAQNLALESVEAWRTEIRPQEGVLLKIRVANQGPVPAAGVELRVQLASQHGPQEVRQSIHIPPATKVTIDVPLAVEREGVYQGRVSIGDSSGAAWDNERWTAFEARHPDRILLVDGQEGRSVYASETYFLETALRLRSENARGPRRSFEIERIVWESGEGFPDLTGHRALILANLRRLSNTDQQRLVRYMEAGGGVLVFAGDQLRAEDWNALAAKDAFPGEVAAQSNAGSFRITAFAGDHAALARFADPQHGDLRRLPLQRILPLKTLLPGAQPLLHCGPHVFAAELAVGQGRCIYVGVTADREWSRWPQSRLYVPVVRQLAAYLTGHLSAAESVASVLVTERNQQPGLEQADRRLLVRNIDPRELTADRWGEEDFRDALALPKKSESLEQQARRAALLLPASALRPDEIWTWLVWGLFGVLLVEMFVASRIHS